MNVSRGKKKSICSWVYGIAVAAGPVLLSSAIQLQQLQQPKSTTASSVTAAAAAAIEVSSTTLSSVAALEVNPDGNGDTDEPFTTKRSAQLFFDLPKNTRFPLVSFFFL